MIGGALELTESSFMKTGKTIDVDKATDSIWRTLNCGIGASEATADSLASLVERFEHVADRLDSV